MRSGTRGPEDVLLVVEVSDETFMADLTTKATMYGAAGYATYWVVARDVVCEHTGPTSAGYRTRTEYRRGDRLPVRHAGTDLLVDDLIGPPPSNAGARIIAGATPQSRRRARDPGASDQRTQILIDQNRH